MDTEVALPMSNAHPYFPSKMWSQSVHRTWQNTAYILWKKPPLEKSG